MIRLTKQRLPFSEYIKMSNDLISCRVGKHPPHVIHSIRWCVEETVMELRPICMYLRDGVDDSPPGKVQLEWKDFRDWGLKWEVES